MPRTSGAWTKVELGGLHSSACYPSRRTIRYPSKRSQGRFDADRNTPAADIGFIWRATIVTFNWGQGEVQHDPPATKLCYSIVAECESDHYRIAY